MESTLFAISTFASAHPSVLGKLTTQMYLLAQQVENQMAVQKKMEAGEEIVWNVGYTEHCVGTLHPLLFCEVSRVKRGTLAACPTLKASGSQDISVRIATATCVGIHVYEDDYGNQRESRYSLEDMAAHVVSALVDGRREI